MFAKNKELTEETDKINFDINIIEHLLYNLRHKVTKMVPATITLKRFKYYPKTSYEKSIIMC